MHLQKEPVSVCRRSKGAAWGVPSKLYRVVCRKQPTFPPQPPFPPRHVSAIHHLDDVAGVEAELVVFLCGEVVQRLHMQRGCPLWKETPD